MLKNCESHYVNNYFKIYKAKKIKTLIIASVTLLVVILSLFFTYLKNIVNPIILNYGESQIAKLISECTNSAINEMFNDINYENLVTVNYSNSGEITSIHANSANINKIGNNLSIKVQDKINNESKMGLSIPIGTCSGIGILSGKGSNLNFSINPIGNTYCNFVTSFTSAGINQTSHKIYVKIQSEVSLILPFNFKKIKNEVEFLIAECVIVGKIPNIYLNMSNLENLN